LDSNFLQRLNKAQHGELSPRYDLNLSEYEQHLVLEFYKPTEDLLQLQTLWIELKKEQKIGLRQSLGLEIQTIEQAMRNAALIIDKSLGFYDLIVVREDDRLIGLLGPKWDRKKPAA